jgi:hypothetical protein
MIQGPLTLDWGSRKFGVMPRTENGDLHAGRPATLRRFHLWLNAAVHVAGRRNAVFIKLHTHGCKDGNIDELLGPSTAQFHAQLQEWRLRSPNYRLHYVTAWEMALAARMLIAGQPLGPWPKTPKPATASNLAPHQDPSTCLSAG